MLNINRRGFLQLTMATLAGNQLHYRSGNELNHDALFDELIQVHRCWFQQIRMAPASFLSQFSNDRLKDQKFLSQQITADFVRGDTVDVNGLLLSKTEAAIMALSVETMGTVS